MNDEDFARQAFAAAFRSGQTGEPPTLPDVELLARDGRRANRNRHGLYAAGTTVVAGVAVAGVVTGPSLLGLGSPSSSDVGSAAGAAASRPPSSPAPSRSRSAPDSVKPSPGVPCATPATINWLSVVSGALPSGVTATADHSANCVQVADGSRSYEALFRLSTGGVTLQVNVGTGPDIAGKLSAGAASKIGIAPASQSPSQSLDPTALASLQARKMAAASSASAAGDATSPSPSPSPGAADVGGIKGVADGTCSQVTANANACISHLTKGSISVVDVELLRTGSSPIVVDVMATNCKDNLATPAPEQLPSDATVLAIAQAVAAHF